MLLACVVVSVSLSACGSAGSEQGMSASLPVEDAVQSQVGSPDDVVAMSGIYEVTREGKLLRYSSDPRLDKPELSDVAKVHDNNGAEEFAQYFIRVVEYTWDSGDTSLLKEISLPSCTWCEYMSATTDERMKNKGWVRNLRATVIEVQPAFEVPDHPGLWHVDTVSETSAHQEYDGKRLKEVEKERVRLSLQMRYEEGAWKISGSKGESISE